MGSAHFFNGCQYCRGYVIEGAAAIALFAAMGYRVVYLVAKEPDKELVNDGSCFCRCCRSSGNGGRRSGGAFGGGLGTGHW